MISASRLPFCETAVAMKTFRRGLPGDIVGPGADTVQPGFNLLSSAERAGAGQFVAVETPAEGAQVAFELPPLVERWGLQRLR